MRKTAQDRQTTGTRLADPAQQDRIASDLLLATTLVSENFTDEGRRYAEFVTSQILRASGWDRPRTESREAAWLALVELEKELEGYAFAIGQRLSSFEWLGFLRRVPWFFTGYDTPTDTSGYATTIAESITALSATRPRSSGAPFPGIGFPVDKELLKSIQRLGAVVFLFINVHAALRCAGKGAAITSREGLTPGTVPNPQLDEMMALWDRRIAGSGYDFLVETGLYTHRFHTIPDRADYPDLVPCVQRSKGRFTLVPLPLGKLPTLLDSTLPVDLRYPTTVLDLVVLLIAGSHRLVYKDPKQGLETKDQLAQFERSGLQFRTREQMLVEIELAATLLREHLLGRSIPEGVSFESAPEILARFTWPEVSVWPPSMGPAVREGADELVLVDLWAATRRLEIALARPTQMAGGEYANVWSSHFERVVQDAIDVSPWQPSKLIGDLRGVPLTVGHNPITDIGAIGERDGRMLLVSCKCIPFSEAWGRGEYNAVRNVASAVDLAVEEWADRLDKLRRTPHGGNYDFSAFTELIGVVVLPSLPWTPTASSVAETAPGLRVASSAGEFDHWISSAETPASWS
jgi:hypothetical protein